jgi:hypothetical protein
MDPALTQNWFNFLQGNMGRGATPFNLQTQLPFGMGTTAPGQLNAPTNQILNNLFSGYTGGSFGNMPGMQTLKTIADQGISALPEWQATVAAEGQNIAATRNQLQESGAATGLAGTPTASAMSAYDQGTAAQQNAMLAQMQQQNILQGQIPAAEAMMQAGTQFGQYAQGLAQQNIQNMYNEFLRTRPEYSPLLGYESQASMAWNPWMQNPLPGGGIMGGIAGAAPGIMSTIGSMIPA